MAIKHTDRFSSVLRAVGHPHRRTVLQYLIEEADGTAGFANIAIELAECTDLTEDEANVSLHHHHLPALAGCDLIEYEVETKRVRCPPDSIPARIEDASDAELDSVATTREGLME